MFVPCLCIRTDGRGEKGEGGVRVEGEVGGGGGRRARVQDRVTDGKIIKVPTGCGRLTCMFDFDG